MDDVLERMGKTATPETREAVARAQTLWNIIGTGVLHEQIVCAIMALTDPNAGRVIVIKDQWDEMPIGTWVSRKREGAAREYGTFQGRARTNGYLSIWENNESDLDRGWLASETRRVTAEEAKALRGVETIERAAQIIKEEAPLPWNDPEPENAEEDTKLKFDMKAAYDTAIEDDIPQHTPVMWSDPETGEDRQGYFRRFEGADIIVGTSKVGTANIRLERSAVMRIPEFKTTTGEAIT